MSDKRIFELPEANTLNPGDKIAIDKSGNTEAKCIDASIILDQFTDLTNNKANKSDLTSISITGSKNNTGSTITSGSFFYKDGTLVRAKTDIANNATLTLNTNYEIVTAGGLNALNNALSDTGWQTVSGYPNMKYRKWGKTVTITGENLSLAITNSWTKIGEFASDYRPTHTIYGIATSEIGSHMVVAKMTSSGALYAAVLSGANSTNLYALTLTYIV